MTAPAAAQTQLRAGQAPIVWAFLFGNLVIGTGVMLVPGMLTVMALDLGVSVPTAGILIGLSAAAVCVGAPTLAAFTARWDRRRLLAGSLVGFGLLHMLCAAAPNFDTLLALRVLAMLAAAVFTPQAAATLGTVLAPQARASAITFVFLGWSLASVLALPVVAWSGNQWGWRVTFFGFGVLSVLGAWVVARTTPRQLQGVPLNWASWVAVLKSPTLMLLLGVTAASAMGQFTTWGYLAPYTQAMLQPSPSQYSLLLSGLGAAGLLGNVWASRNASRTQRWGGPQWNVHLASASMAMGMLALAMAGHTWVGYCLAGLLWGVGIFASNSSQQARLAQASPELAPAAIALNTSMIYLGQAVGSALGGVIIESWGFALLPWAGVVLLSLAIGLSVWAQRH